MKLVDSLLPSATLSLDHLTENERLAAAELADLMILPLGTLLRRAEAVRLAGGRDTFTDCLREAAQQLILILGDPDGERQS
jgi:hypothetical protein